MKSLKAFALFFVLTGSFLNAQDVKAITTEKEWETIRKILPKTVDVSKFVYRGNKFYRVNSANPYTGWIKKQTDSGQVAELKQVKHGKLEGLLRKWHENGQKKLEVNYKNGKQEGLDMGWYENGQKQVEVNYKNGKQEGLAVTWHENGQKWQERTYKNGENNGLAREWNRDGKLTTETTWDNGRIVSIKEY